MTENKTEKAVALKYEKGRNAPTVVAGGKGPIAEKILAAAREAGVEVVEDPDLVELLAKIPLGAEIPPELYQAVAEILAFVYRINNRYGGDSS
ncbi:MAG: EscU/YscU/HrcU family type III secretion system export apparatus switch protein [Syntrophotaleaceae bacterium]